MNPDPLRLLETAHPLRSGSISQGSPKPRFAIRPNCRLKRPSKLVNKTVNNFIKFVDGPTQMSRRRFDVFRGEKRPNRNRRSKIEHEHDLETNQALGPNELSNRSEPPGPKSYPSEIPSNRPPHEHLEDLAGSEEVVKI